MSYWEHREGGGGTGKIEVSSIMNRLGEEGGDSRHRRDPLRGPGWLQWDGGGEGMQWRGRGVRPGKEGEAGPGGFTSHARKLGFIWKILKPGSKRVRFGV